MKSNCVIHKVIQQIFRVLYPQALHGLPLNFLGSPSVGYNSQFTLRELQYLSYGWCLCPLYKHALIGGNQLSNKHQK